MKQMKPMNCDDIAVLIPAYALEALTQAEQAMVQEHVLKCADCRSLLVEQQALADGLLYTAPPVSAPPHLEADLRRRLAEARAKEAKPPLPTWRDRLFSPAARPALAVSIVLLLMLATSNLYWLGTTTQLDTHQARLAQELEHAELGEEMLYDAMQLLATGARYVVLRGEAPAPQAVGTLTVAPHRPEAFLVVNDMPPLPPGKAYQLWLITDGERESGGVFELEGEDDVFVVRPQRPIEDYQGVEMTLEPVEGSPRPTGPRVLEGRM